tara:strand:+ start:39259 stop:45195 length:5937 start_codon:yes stop_codon:yes gene_type:complete
MATEEPTLSLSDYLVTPEDITNAQLSGNNMLATPSQVTTQEPNYEMEKLALKKAGTNRTLTDAEKSSGMLNPLYGTKLDGVKVEDYADYIDRPFSFVSDDADELRAANQSTGEKLRYGATKLVSSVGTNILGSTVGLVYGGVAFLEGMINKDSNTATKAFFDNNFQRSLDGVNEWMDNKLPHYYTKEEQEYGFLQSLGTANMWTNDFAQGLSFVIGAVLSEGLTAGRTSSLLKNLAKKSGVKGKDWLKAANKNSDLAVNAVARSKQLQNGLTTIRQLGTGAMYESGVEARHHYDATLEMLIDAHKAEHNNNPPTDQEMAALADIATKSSNAVFAGNMALVGYGNFMQFPKIFGKGLNGTKRAMAGKIKQQIVDKKKIYSEVFKDLSKGQVMTRKAWKLASVPLYEGFVEEGGQKLLDLTGQGSAEEFYLSKRNPAVLDMLGEMLIQTEDSFSDVYGSKEGQKEIGIGLILGALGLPGRVSTRGKDGKLKKKIQMQGGVWDTMRDMKSQQKAISKLRERLEKDPTFLSAFKKNYDTMARATDNQDITDYASIIDNPFISQNAEHDNVFNYLHSRMEAGFEADILDDIQNVREMSAEEFRNAFNYNEANTYSDKELEARRDNIASALEAKLESVKETMDVMDRSFINWSAEQKMAAVHALSVAKDSDMREDDLISRAEEIIGAPLATDVEAPREETDAREQKDTENRLKNIWSRFSKKHMENINNLPETQTVKQRLGIKEFSDPTHLEELFREITINAMNLENQIEELGHNDKIDKYEKDSKLIKLAADKKKLDVRRSQLMKDLNEGLDPNIGGAEQQILDDWKKKDPTGYASSAQEVTQMLKDLRKLRARRHRAINMYNQLLEKRDVGATLFSEGPLLTPPQIRLQQIVQREASENKALFEDDPKLHDLYRRFSDQTIEFEYTKEGDTEPTQYRVFVERKDIEDGNASVLRQMPTPDIIKLSIQKQALEDRKARLESVIKRLADATTTSDYSEAQTNLANIDIQLGNITATLESKQVGKTLTLNLLNKASNIKVIENSALVKEQVNQAVDLVNIELESNLQKANKTLSGLNSKLALLTEALKDPTSVEAGQTESLRADIDILNEAIVEVKRTVSETKTNLKVLQRFEGKVSTITTMPQAEQLMNSIYESLFNFDKIGEYKEVYELINKSSVKSLIMTSIDGKPSLDNDKLQRYAEILRDGRDVTTAILTEFEPKIADLESSSAALKETIEKLSEKINELKLEEGKLVDELEETKNQYEEQLEEIANIKAMFKEELLNVQRGVNSIADVAFSLKDNLYAIKALIDSYKNPNLKEESLSGYHDTNMMALTPDEFLNKVGNSKSKSVLHYRSPITKHGFLKTAGSNVASLKTIQRLEKQVNEGTPLDAEQTNEYNLAKSAAAYYKFTSENNFNTRKYKDGKGDFSLLLVNRHNLPSELKSDLVFFDEGKHVLAPATTGTIKQENLEDIKAIVLNKDGEPHKVNGVMLYTSIPTAEVFETKQTSDGRSIERYKYGEADLISPVEEEIIDEEGYTKTVFTGELTPTAKARVKEYTKLRTDLLTDPQPKIRKITQNSFAMVNKVNGDNIGRPSKTFKGNTSNIDLKVNMKSGLSISGRSYNFSAGTVVAEAAGKPVPMYGNFLTDKYQKNVLNLLKLYAVNQKKYQNKEIDYAQSQLVEPTNPNSKKITHVLQNLVFFGLETQNRGERKFFVSSAEENGTVYFGDLKIETSKLLDPGNNKDLNDDLKSFIGSLRHNVNAYTLKADQGARAKGKQKGTYAAARKEYAKRVKNNKEKLDKWELANAYRKSNAKVEYEGYVEYTVNDDLTVSKTDWANYTDYLLGDGTAESRRSIPQEIPLYSYLNDYVSEDKNKSYSTPQFLNTYLQYEEGYDIGKMTNLEDFKKTNTDDTSDTETTTETTTNTESKPPEESGADIGGLKIMSVDDLADLMGTSDTEGSSSADISLNDILGLDTKHDSTPDDNAECI